MRALQWLLVVLAVCAIAYGIYRVVEKRKSGREAVRSTREAGSPQPAPPAANAGAILTISLYGGFHLGDKFEDLTSHLESEGIKFASEPRAHEISFRVSQSVLGLQPPLPVEVTVISVAGNIEEVAVSATGQSQSDAFRLFGLWMAAIKQTCGEPSNKSESASERSASWSNGGNTLSLDASRDDTGGTYTAQIDLSSSALP